MYDYKNINVITEKANYYANELWGVNLNIPVKRNNRLSRSLGRYIWEDYKGLEIEIAGKMFVNDYNELTVDGVIVHELCHWYCHLNKLDWDDSSVAFQDFVVKSGGILCKHIKPVFNAYFGKCPVCNKEYRLYGYKDGKINKYTGCCGNKLVFSRVEKYEDIFVPSELLINLNKNFKEYYSDKISA